MPGSRRRQRRRYSETSDSDSDDDENIRVYTPCPNISHIIEEKGIVQPCDNCGFFVTPCCPHRDTTCHYRRIVCTDGACLQNGRDGTTAGIGIVMGEYPEQQWSIPVDYDLDNGGRRTSQRAELLAATQGLKKAEEIATEYGGKNAEESVLVIITDSQYVVSGMSEWLSAWKSRGWRKSDGSLPSNLDLFQSLDATIDRQRVFKKVKFWQVPRSLNETADRLAKDGAIRADVPKMEYAVSAFTLL